MAQLGGDCILYRNSATYATPTWDDIPIIRDLTLSLEKGDDDVTTRAANGWRQKMGTLKDGSVEFEIIWETGDADFEAVRDSFMNDTLIDLAVMDGDVTTTGQQGLRAEFETFGFNRQEPIEGAVKAAVNCGPGYSSNAPTWLVVS